ncbi:DUF937 domain-containing protein [Flavobacterium sp. UMI-01]|uniref:DUF937 domain-containing protein n=1 Tax=Flavobacterium sp. UMI-01 TaxID=1441053 RepID=UPI001C7DEE0C|nr:DUF937 domain-containing protein [Flavobacterium sp. UMI-01]GIZ07602.1 hypothetical protein FUMI01_03290 [Flavobacterium sp. UMI-01]
MLDILSQLTEQLGADTIVNNANIPNEQNQTVIKETSNAIFSSLQAIANKGDLSQIAGLLQGKELDKNDPTVKEITAQVTHSLTQKTGLSSTVASGAVTAIIPKLLNALIGKANDPKDNSINISDIVNTLTGNGSAEHAGIMEAISTYGVHFGLDQNADGKVDLDDAIELTKKGGIAGMFGKLFGK